MKKQLLLFAVVLLWSLSLACGGGGGGTSSTVSFSITDFLGTWSITFSAKADNATLSGLYLNVASDGSIFPEPQSIAIYPLVVGGQFTLVNNKTGEFTAQVILDNSSAPDDNSTITLTGTLSKDKTTLILTSPAGATSARVNFVSDAVGLYSVERYSSMPVKMIAEVMIIELFADGTMTVTSDAVDTGTWKIFRDRYIKALLVVQDDEGPTQTINIYMELVQNDALVNAQIPSLTGSYTAEAGEDQESGTFVGYTLSRTSPLFSTADVAHKWSVLSNEYEYGIHQETGFQINTDGIPAQGEVLSGTIDSLDTITGKFVLLMDIFNMGEINITGYLSPGGLYASASEFLVSTNEEMGSLVLVNEDNTTIDWASRSGNWCVGTFNELNEMGVTYFMNVTADVDGNIAMLDKFDMDGTITMLAPDLYSVWIHIYQSSDATFEDNTIWLLANMNPADNATDMAMIRIDSNDDYEGRGLLSRIGMTTQEQVIDDVSGGYLDPSYPDSMTYFFPTEDGLEIVSLVSNGFATIIDANLYFFDYSITDIISGDDDDEEVHDGVLFFTPVEVIELLGTAVVFSNPGAFASREILKTGAVYGTGDNSYGQLGIGHENPPEGLEAAIGLTDVTAVAVSNCHSLALRSDRTVWAFGRNEDGELGIGDVENRNIPEQTPLNDVIQISAGNNYSMALSADGLVWTWGANGNMQLGDGTTEPRNLPEIVWGLPRIKYIAASGMSTAYAIDIDGNLWSWGDNCYGQLGNGTTEGPNGYPTMISILGAPKFTMVSPGDQGHCLALDTDGNVWSWGLDFAGKLGNGEGGSNYVPEMIAGFTNVTTVGAGSNFSLALKDDGTVWAWGINVNGLLGDGTTIDQQSPVQVVGLGYVDKIWPGSNYSIARLDNGQIYFWGYGTAGNKQNLGYTDVYYLATWYHFNLYIMPEPAK